MNMKVTFPSPFLHKYTHLNTLTYILTHIWVYPLNTFTLTWAYTDTLTHTHAP